LLDQLVSGQDFGSWAHFELEKRNGWVDRLFAGIEASVEVALNEDRFDVILIKESPDVGFPPSWTRQKNGIIHVALGEQESLACWIDSYFQPLLAKNPSFTLKGWLDGL